MKKKERISPIAYVFGIAVMLVTMYVTKSFLFPQGKKVYSSNEGEQSAKEECMFDLSTQTDDFLKNKN